MSTTIEQFDAYLQKKNKIDKALARLQKLSDQEFELDPDKITWGDIADLGRIAEHLTELTDIVFHEGEHLK